MKKIIGIILVGTFLFLSQSCSYDEDVLEENTKLTEEFNGKMGVSSGNEGPILEGCEIEFTFNDPFLTPAEKAAIRASYSFFYSYTIIDNDTEIWVVNCATYYDYNDLNPGGDDNGTYIITSGCPRAGCGSTPPKDPDPIEDPFGSNN